MCTVLLNLCASVFSRCSQIITEVKYWYLGEHSGLRFAVLSSAQTSANMQPPENILSLWKKSHFNTGNMLTNESGEVIDITLFLYSESEDKN